MPQLTNIAVRVVKDGHEDADLPPPNFLPDLNVPPSNYFLLPMLPPPDLPTHVANAGSQLLLTASPADSSSVVISASRRLSRVDEFFGEPRSLVVGSMVGGRPCEAKHSTDDLMGLLEEVCHAELYGSPDHSDGVKTPPFPGSDSDCGVAQAFGGSQMEGSAYLDEDVINMVCMTPTNTSRNGSVSSPSPSTADASPTDRQDTGLNDLASYSDDDTPHDTPIYYPLNDDTERRSSADYAGGHSSSMPTLLASGEDFKSLILAHQRTSKPLTFLAHRVGPTVFLEGRPTEGGMDGVQEARQHAMREKLLCYAKMLSPPGPSSQPASRKPRRPPQSKQQEGPPTTAVVGVVGDSYARGERLSERKSDFKRAFKWKVQDMNVLIGVDTPIYRNPSNNERTVMHLHDVSNDEANPPRKADRKRPKPKRPTKGDSGAEGQLSFCTPNSQITNFSIEALEDDDEEDATPAPPRRGRVLGSAALGAQPTTQHQTNHSSSDEDEGVEDPDAYLPSLGQDEALDMWIDAVMTNSRNVAVCLHRDGVVQGYQVVPISKLVSMSTPAFSPVTVQASATGILQWLQETTELGTSFLIVKDSDSSELRLFDLSNMQPGSQVPLVDTYDSHPDSRKRWRNPVTTQPTSLDRHVDPATLYTADQRSSRLVSSRESPVASMDLVVPPGGDPSGLNDIDEVSPPVHSMRVSSSAPHHAGFDQVGFPLAMMCFRMAQCLPGSDAESLRLWLRVITLLPPHSEESFLPLAVAHVHAMEHFHSSSPLPDAERQALTHCRLALQALHRLRLSLLDIAVLSKPESKTHLASRNSETYTAKLIDEFSETDAEVGAMVAEAKRLSTRIVKCMSAMAMQQLRGEGSGEMPPVSGDSIESPLHHQQRKISAVATMIGRAMENVLFAQEALALRAHEAPSGLIMASPEHTASASPTTMSEVGAASPSGQFPLPPPLFSNRFDVTACFEVVSTLSADIAARFLQTVMELRSVETSTQQNRPPHECATNDVGLVDAFVTKVNREVKVTLAVMNTVWRLRGTGAVTGVESSTPEHINFVDRISPFCADPLKTFDAASALYHVALAYNNILFSGRGAACVALRRKVAGLNAIVAEMYARGLVVAGEEASPGSHPPPHTLVPKGTSTPSTVGNEEKAIYFYDRAAKSFIVCRDYPNAARNLINAAKVSLRMTPLSSIGAAAFSKETFPRTEEAVATAMKPVHTAIDFLELIDRFGSHIGASSASADAIASVVAEAQQMLFNVYLFAFRSRASFYINPVTGSDGGASFAVLTMSAAVESFLHDRYLNPASRQPKKFARLISATPGAPSEDTIRRASEVKVLRLMLGLHWMCASPSASVTQALAPPVGTKPMSLADIVKRRLNSARHAKHRLRQLWGYVVYPEGPCVPCGLFLEACELTVKMMQCEAFLISVASSGVEVPGEQTGTDALLEAVERCITAANDLRPWVVAAENNQLDRQQAALTVNTTAIGGGGAGGASRRKGKKAPAVDAVERYIHLQEVGQALAPIPSLLSSTLMALLRLVKGSPNSVEGQSIKGAIEKCLSLTPQGDSGVPAPAVVECLHIATTIFKGKKRHQQNSA